MAGDSIPGEVRLAANTKGCVEALGSDQGLGALAEAGFDSVVLWAGESLELLDSAARARALDLDVIGLATPKISAAAFASGRLVETCCEAAAGADIPLVSFIFDDRRSAWAPHCATVDALCAAPVAVAIENNANPADHLSSLDRLWAFTGTLDGCQVVLDLGHAGVADVPIAQPAGGELAWIDFHDNDGAEDLHWPLGRGAGRGDSREALTPALAAAAPLVVETDARAGDDRTAWTRSLRRDRELLLCALDSLGATQAEAPS